MSAAGPNDLARALRAFFADHLPRVRGTSPHTVQSYRDSLVVRHVIIFGYGHGYSEQSSTNHSTAHPNV